MFLGFSPGNLNYMISSVKITSSSALLILLPYAFLFLVLGVILCSISPAFSQIWSGALLRVLSLQGRNFGSLSLKWLKPTDLLPQGGKRLLGEEEKSLFTNSPECQPFLVAKASFLSVWKVKEATYQLFFKSRIENFPLFCKTDSFFTEADIWGERLLHPLCVPGVCHFSFLIITRIFVFCRCVSSVFTALPLIPYASIKNSLTSLLLLAIFKSLHCPVFVLTESRLLISIQSQIPISSVEVISREEVQNLYVPKSG